MPPRRADYTRKLSRRITLADGRALAALKDAADLLLDVFGSVNARSGVLDAGIARLMQAATTGKRADIEAPSQRCGRACIRRYPTISGE